MLPGGNRSPCYLALDSKLGEIFDFERFMNFLEISWGFLGLFLGSHGFIFLINNSFSPWPGRRGHVDIAEVGTSDTSEAGGGRRGAFCF